MLDPWALTRSAWKKRPAWWLFENRNLRTAACIHALCECEYQSIRARGLKNPVCIVPNGVNLPVPAAAQKPPPWAQHVRKNMNVLLFLGRIHPKKGLVNLIRAWSILRERRLTEFDEWHLVIAGWSQIGHEDELKRLACDLRVHESVSFVGSLYGEVKESALWAADAFILPSFSEGLPMSVLEAWACGLPVIMTRECNLPEGFEAGVAIEVMPTASSIFEGLTHFMKLSDSGRKTIGDKGRRLAETKFEWPEVARQMIAVYEWVRGEGEKPECVRLT